MIQDTIDFYNNESEMYSVKRYPEVTASYIHYLFKKRLEIFLGFISQIEQLLPENATVLEIGCADGIVLRALEERFPGRFSKLIGLDISQDMIEEAKRRNENPRAQFLLRKEFSNETFDLVIELGVHHYNLREECLYVCNHLKKTGYFSYSLAGRNSSHVYFKSEGREKIVDEYLPYSSYELTLSKFFSISATSVYGLFVPKLWTFPIIGRGLQPVVDSLFKHIVPELFHEKIYFLRSKN